jgi:4-amino-4-deoxy-L-arabinose transferase-like glycosyltransferase
MVAFKKVRTHKLQFLWVVLIAMAVRFTGIFFRPSIRYDEAFSILFSEKGLRAMIEGTLSLTGSTAADIHPLGYYTLLWAWMNLFGKSLVATRMLSLMAGLGIIILTYLLAKELFDNRVAILAMALVALSPFQVRYAQEIRMYAFLAFWLLLATLAYLKGTKTMRWYWWAVFAFSSALAQYTHNLAAFYLIALATVPLFSKNWKSLKAVIVSGFMAIILYLPWLVHLPSQFAKIVQAYWIERPGPEKVFTLLLTYTTYLPLPDKWILPATFVALLVFSLAVWQTVKSRNTQNFSKGLLVFYLAFAPPFLVFFVSQWNPVFLERTFLPSGVIYCIWVAWALLDTNLPQKVGLFVLASILIVMISGLFQYTTYIDFPYGPFQEMGRYLAKNRQAGDVIVHSNKLSLLPAIYFNRSLPQEFIADAQESQSDTLAPSTQAVLGVKESPDMESAVNQAPRVWLIIFKRSIDEYTQAGFPTHEHIVWLNEHYRLDHEEDWGSLKLYLYIR